MKCVSYSAYDQPSCHPRFHHDEGFTDDYHDRCFSNSTIANPRQQIKGNQRVHVTARAPWTRMNCEEPTLVLQLTRMTKSNLTWIADKVCLSSSGPPGCGLSKEYVCSKSPKASIRDWHLSSRIYLAWRIPRRYSNYTMYKNTRTILVYGVRAVAYSLCSSLFCQHGLAVAMTKTQWAW